MQTCGAQRDNFAQDEGVRYGRIKTSQIDDVIGTWFLSDGGQAITSARCGARRRPFMVFLSESGAFATASGWLTKGHVTAFVYLRSFKAEWVRNAAIAARNLIIATVSFCLNGQVF
jgi:hypothetical protein